VRFPLDRPQRPLRTVVTARAPARLPDQVMTVVLNGHVLRRSPLGAAWTDVEVLLVKEAQLPGENLLCLEFSEGLAPSEQEGLAASVARIQLP
jgi:hypothetical protein